MSTIKSTARSAMKLALEALEMWCPMTATYRNTRDKAITALREALAQERSSDEQPAQQYPVVGVVLRDGQPTLLQDKHIEETDERLFRAAPPAQQEPAEIVDANDEGYWAEILPDRSVKVGQLLYTSPPTLSLAQRKPLTDAQINAFFEGMEPNNGFWLSFARAIEAAHGIYAPKELKEKNT